MANSSSSDLIKLIIAEGYQWNKVLIELSQKANAYLQANPDYEWSVDSISHSAGMGGQSTFDNTHYLSLTLVPTSERHSKDPSTLAVLGAEDECFLTCSGKLEEKINRFRSQEFTKAWNLTETTHVMVPGGTKGGQFHHFRYVVLFPDLD